MNTQNDQQGVERMGLCHLMQVSILLLLARFLLGLKNGVRAGYS